jgi:type II secretory pathway pseudopilin PulG
VVIAVIALLLALLIPALRSAREQGQRAVCLSNLKQLTLAWLAYADEHDSALVYGATGTLTSTKRTMNGGIKTIILQGWASSAFSTSSTRAELIADPNKGALWPWIKNVDIYRCPRIQADNLLTYAVVPSANGGTRVPGTSWGNDYLGIRIGSTVLKLSRLTDIVSPGAGQRAVFIDGGNRGYNGSYYVEYLQPRWYKSDAPIHHHDGTTLSMADGHAEYWKWKGRETVVDAVRRSGV